jgi:DNA polymerase I-like protein with 3'-5' exonuclease and polymerase domains
MTEWKPSSALPDLRHVDILALDTETKDGGLLAGCGSAWPWGDGFIVGISVAYRAEGEIRAHYFPIRHPDSENFEPEQLFQWLRDLFASDVPICTQNGLYDFGWLRADAGIVMPSSNRLEEIGALATMVDENRKRYSLESLCAWRGLPGKNETSLKEGAAALGFPKKAKLATLIWQLPAHYVGPYAETDAIRTLELFENLNPILDQENTRGAYRLEVDLLPMVHEMRRRGIRIDTAVAEQARDLLLGKRDAILAELSEKLGTNVGMDELNRSAWRAAVFDQHKIAYPKTEKGNPSFTAGNSGWMPKHPHWLPQLIVKADKFHNYGENFLGTYILGHTINGRVFAEIHPHRGDDGSGTRSLRFSYSSPPLQLMPKHDEELAPLIRGVFLPEQGEVWAECDVSQQEFRMIVHYAARHRLSKAADAVEKFRTDPNTDFHELVAGWTGRDRQTSKNTNFAKAYGAGVGKFAAMIGKSEKEAAAIFDQYDRELPFVSQLSTLCERAVRRKGYLTLYSGARRHWNDWAPGGQWKKGAGPCPRDEAEVRVNNREHSWFGKPLWRANCRLAMNSLIQGSSAAHTKLWMRACWREGIVPLLQMHDALELSLSSPEQAERVAELGCDVVQLEVPMMVDIAFGRTWGDARHTWAELQPAPTPEGAKISVSYADPKPSPPQDDGGGGGGDHLINDATIAIEKSPPAHQVNWAAALEQDFPRATAAAAQPTPPSSQPTINEPPQHDAGNGYGGSNADDYCRGETETSKSSPSATYVYKDERGAFYMKVVRTTAKIFPTYHWKNVDWAKGWPEKVLPYRLPELLAAPSSEPVWICEGEKDADNVAALGLVATTNPGGAGKWQPELAQWFKGKQLAYILEDSDEAGRAHTAKIIAALRGIVPTIAVISFPELPVKSDVSDWLAAGGNKQLLLARAEEAKKRSTTRNYTIINLTTVTARAHKWLWPGHLVRGNLELMTGIKGLGKSQIQCQYIAHVTTGRAWPNGVPGIAPCRVIMLTAEDNTADTLKPRLMAADADLDLIGVLTKIRRNNRDELFLLSEDLNELEKAIRDYGDVGLVTIDPITAYMGGGKNFDSHRVTDVRSQLTPLKELAERTGVCFSAVTHPPKNASQRALDNFIGSRAFIDAARIGHLCVPEMEDDPATGKRETGRYLFTNPAINVAGRQPTLAYRMDVVEVGFDPDGTVIPAPVIRWEGEVEITAQEALDATKTTKTNRGTAREFLNIILANGPALRNLIVERGAEHGFSPDQLKRARHTLKVKAFRKRGEGKNSPWWWAFPEDMPADAEEGDD